MIGRITFIVLEFSLPIEFVRDLFEFILLLILDRSEFKEIINKEIQI